MFTECVDSQSCVVGEKERENGARKTGRQEEKEKERKGNKRKKRRNQKENFY